MNNRLFVRILIAAIGGGVTVAAGNDSTVSKTVITTAELGDISTDRPDFTEATDTLAPGFIQVEGGILFNRHALASTRSVSGPSPLIRIGLSRIMELRVGSDGYVVESEAGEGHREGYGGYSDIEAGVKVKFWNERRYLPALSVIGALSLPTGSSHFTNGGPDPVLDLCWSKSLRGNFDIGGNVNFLRRVSSARTEHGYSVTGGRRVGRSFRIYAEIYRISPIEGDEAAHWITDGGVTKLLGSSMQVDLSIGHSLNADTPCWYVAVGFAFRMQLPETFRRLARR